MLCMNGLAGDAEGVADLLPRPASGAGQRDLVGLYPLSQAAQREHGAQPNSRVVGGEDRGDLGGIHSVSLD